MELVIENIVERRRIIRTITASNFPEPHLPFSCRYLARPAYLSPKHL